MQCTLWADAGGGEQLCTLLWAASQCQVQRATAPAPCFNFGGTETAPPASVPSTQYFPASICSVKNRLNWISRCNKVLVRTNNNYWDLTKTRQNLTYYRHQGWIKSCFLVRTITNMFQKRDRQFHCLSLVIKFQKNYLWQDCNPGPRNWLPQLPQ